MSRNSSIEVQDHLNAVQAIRDQLLLLLVEHLGVWNNDGEFIGGRVACCHGDIWIRLLRGVANRCRINFTLITRVPQKIPCSACWLFYCLAMLITTCCYCCTIMSWCKQLREQTQAPHQGRWLTKQMNISKELLDLPTTAIWIPKGSWISIGSVRWKETCGNVTVAN